VPNHIIVYIDTNFSVIFLTARRLFVGIALQVRRKVGAQFKK